MVTFLSSMGCGALQGHFDEIQASSSEKELHCVPGSPGWDYSTTPKSHIADTVWCGERKGRLYIGEAPCPSFPATNGSWFFKGFMGVSGGRMVGILFSQHGFPAPGGPMRITLCPPAAAISRARLIFFLTPFTSLKSTSC